MSEPIGEVVRPGRDHEHRLRSRVGPWLEDEIYCARWRCRYREINPRGVEAEFRRRREQLEQSIAETESRRDSGG